MYMTELEQKILYEIEEKLLSGIEDQACVSLGPESVMLDGEFSVEDLKKITAALEAVKSEFARVGEYDALDDSGS